MSYRLIFHKSALKEWQKLDEQLRQQFKLKLTERLENPRVQADALRDIPHGYKIKLRQAGYRLIYQVNDEEILVAVLCIGKREGNEAYVKAKNRLT